MGASTKTRERIIEVAAALIDEHGESSVRIRELADSVGITQPSLYHHFKNREAVLEAAHLHRFVTKQTLYVTQFHADTHACSSQDDFVTVLSNFFDFAQSDDSQTIREARITVMAGALRRPSLMTSVTESLDALATTMSEALLFARSRGWVRADLDAVAFTYWLMGELTVLIFAESTGRKDLRPAISTDVRQAVRLNLGLPLL
jgi:AcrR family transcriptional regulator